MTATTSSRSRAISSTSSPKTEVHDACFDGGRTAGDRVDDADGVELVGVVVDGRVVALALLGDHVDDDGSALVLLGPGQSLLDALEVVAVDRAEVFDAEFVEHAGLLGADHVLEPLLHPVDRAVRGTAGGTGLPERRLAPREELLVAGGRPQFVEVGGEPADGRGRRSGRCR